MLIEKVECVFSAYPSSTITMNFLTIPDLSCAPTDYPPPDPAIQYTFALDIWQQYAVSAIHKAHNVLVTAKTGSGKTLVGEYQIAHSLSQGKRVFYTTPIKSLSNQKYNDLKHLFPSASVGVMTGDIKSNPEADIVVMTTEILRNLLFKQSTTTETLGIAGTLSLENVDAVVFDEVHYINDPERGHVWEETLILLPSHIKLILLSATIDSPELFAEWLGVAKQRPILLLATKHRIVPLIHGVWDPTQKSLPLQPLKKGDEAPYESQIYTKWLRARDAHTKAADEWSATVARAKVLGESVAGSDNKIKVHSFTNTLNYAIQELQSRDLLPALFFVFSRKDCEKYAQQVQGSLLDSSDTAAVKHIIQFHLHTYMSTLETLPQYHQIIRLLERGIAFHHSGLLPLLKEIVELLFSKGYVRVLFCTETFAVGLNMPARTVVFLDLKKPAEQHGFRLIRPDEYIQMAGRAGRRGKDKQGVVIYMPARNPIEPDEMIAIMSGSLAPLTSRIHFHYDFILKALHCSKSESTSEIMWDAIVNQSYWKRQQDLHIQDLVRKKEEYEKRIVSECALTPLEADAMQTKKLLETQVKTLVNAPRKRAQGDYDKWKERHAGPKWKQVETMYEQKQKMQTIIEEINTGIQSASQPLSLRIQPILNALQDWNAVEDAAVIPPTQTLFGLLATELNEGNPMLITKLYLSQRLKDASPEEIVAALGLFIVDREAMNKSVEPAALPTHFNDSFRELMYEIDTWACQGITIDKKYGIQSPDGFWDLSTFWACIGYEWLQGGSAAHIASMYEIYEGNLMKGLLKLANLVNEWINLATYVADVDMLKKMESINLLRDIACPESLYLKL